MSISKVASIASVGASAPLIGASSTRFSEVLSSAKGAALLDMPASIAVIEKRIRGGTTIAPSELLAAQIDIHRFNLKVELVSKAAESIASTIKRIQQQI